MYENVMLCIMTKAKLHIQAAEQHMKYGSTRKEQYHRQRANDLMFGTHYQHEHHAQHHAQRHAQHHAHHPHHGMQADALANMQRLLTLLSSNASNRHKPIASIHEPMQNIESHRGPVRFKLPMERSESPMDRSLPVERIELPIDRSELPVERIELPMERSELPIGRIDMERMELPMERMELPMDRSLNMEDESDVQSPMMYANAGQTPILATVASIKSPLQLKPMLEYLEHVKKRRTSENMLKGMKTVIQSRGSDAEMYLIRPDSYCSTRAVFCALFVSQSAHLVKRLRMLHEQVAALGEQEVIAINMHWQLSWETEGVSVHSVLLRCIHDVIQAAKKAQKLRDKPTRGRFLKEMLDNTPLFDMICNEVMKLSMYIHYCNLETAPRRSSQLHLANLNATEHSSAFFLQDRLPFIGLSERPTRQHMVLLALAMHTIIKVYTLDSADTLSHMPEEVMPGWPQIAVVTEDGRHYNVI